MSLYSLSGINMEMKKSKEQWQQVEWKIGSPLDLGQMIRQLRKESGLTLKKAAEYCDVNYRFLVELEHGKPSLRLSHVMKVMNAFGIILIMRRQGLK